jgi:hypothetical protein
MSNYKDFLDTIFYGDGLLMKGFPIFLKAVRTAELNKYDHNIIPYHYIKTYYENQDVVQVFKPQVKIYNHIPIISLLPFERVYIDTMYLTQKNSVLAFINIVDLFSKYAYSKCFLLGANVSAISSSKSLIVFNEFLQNIKKYNIPIGMLYSDRGSEFLGDFMVGLEKEKIIHIYSDAGDKRKMSPIERFNKTLRLYLEKYKVVYGKIDSNVLNKIMNTYNNIPHSKLKYSPIEILNNKKYQDEITSNNYLLQKSIKFEKPIDGYVRILLTKNAFKKVSPIWSSEIYKIKSFSNGNYILEELPDKYFKRDELLPVDKVNLMGKIKIKEDVKKIIKDEPVYEKRIIIKKKKVINDIDIVKEELKNKSFKFDGEKCIIDKVIYSKTYKNYLVDFKNSKNEEEQGLLSEILTFCRSESWYDKNKNIFESIINKWGEK